MEKSAFRTSAMVIFQLKRFITFFASFGITLVTMGFTGFAHCSTIITRRTGVKTGIVKKMEVRSTGETLFFIAGITIGLTGGTFLFS
jgi:hypothetical protein